MAFEGHKGRKAKKGQEGQKNKYGSKCLELSNSARNAKIAKNFQKVPKAWRSMDIRPNGLWSWNYIYIYVRNIMLIFIHHNLLNTIFRKKLTQASLHTCKALIMLNAKMMGLSELVGSYHSTEKETISASQVIPMMKNILIMAVICFLF